MYVIITIISAYRINNVLNQNFLKYRDALRAYLHCFDSSC